MRAPRSNDQNKTARSSPKAPPDNGIHFHVQHPSDSRPAKIYEEIHSRVTQRSRFHPPLSGHLMVRVVMTTDAEAEKLAGGVLNLESLDLQGALEEPVAGLEVPVAPPQEVHAADGEEVSRGQPLQERLELI